MPTYPNQAKKVRILKKYVWFQWFWAKKNQKLGFTSKYQKVTLRIFLFFSFFQHIFMAALYGEGDVGEMGFSEMG